MKASHWQRLQELFDHLLELPETARADWLIANESDPALRDEALRLVMTHEAENISLTARLGEVVDAAIEQPARGTRLGPYVLLGEIGSGGMGTVFLAERVDAEFDRQVAIKLIRGIPTRDASQRLRRERQILANLSHPNIAPLLDGGTTDAGQPYLVMEFIEGASTDETPSPDTLDERSGELASLQAITKAPSIIEYCRVQGIPRARRLRLLQQVCRAVHYAHQRLIIHRDLKPANVLVRRDGSPVLLDFGIAKLLDSETSGEQTQTGVPWFTPAYASPEQRTGRSVSTATDIYGLGALMYQLLTDEVPHPDDKGRLPPPSSVRNASGERGGDHELDIITAKATHPEADRRYASGEALANDIERYLRGRPIQAAADSLSYRCQKFVRRHVWGVAAMGVLLGLTLGFIWKLSSENERARRAEEVAQRESKAASRVVDYLVGLFDAASPDKVGGRPISPAELVDTGVRELSDQLKDQPQPRARLFVALGEIYAKLGRTERGIATMVEAIRLQREIDDPVRLSKSLQLYGNMLNSSGRFAAASDVLLEGIALQEARPEPDPAAMAEMLTSLSLVSGRIGQVLASISHAERALRFAAAAGGKAGMLRGEASNALSEAHLRNGETARAIEISRRNVAELEALPEVRTTLLGAKEFLAANLAEGGEFAEAEMLLRSVLAERLERTDPNSDWVIGLRNQLAMVVRNLGKPLESIALLQTNIESMKAREETATPSYAIALNNLGSLNENVGDIETAIPLLREAMRLADSDPDTGNARRDIYRQSLGRMLTVTGSYAEALSLLEHEIADDGSEDRRIARLRRLIHLADWHRLNRHYESAHDYLGEAQVNLRDNFGERHPRALTVLRVQGLLARDERQWSDAETHLLAALALAENIVGSDANPTTEIRIDLIGVLLARGKQEAAREQLEIADPNVHARFSQHSSVNERFVRYVSQLERPLRAAATGKDAIHGT